MNDCSLKHFCLSCAAAEQGERGGRKSMISPQDLQLLWTSFSTKEVCLGNILLERGRSHCRIRGPGGTWEVISFNPLILETRHFLYLLKWKYLFQVIQVKNGTRARARMFCFFHYIITRLCSLLGKEGSYVAPCVGLFLRTGLKGY